MSFCLNISVGLLIPENAPTHLIRISEWQTQMALIHADMSPNRDQMSVL